MTRPYDEMQNAVDIVNSSPHPVNRIAATLFRDDFSVSCTNDWPQPIKDKIGPDKKIGISSGTVHAEVYAVLSAFPEKTAGASLCVTDPFCPNCAKNLSDAGIKNIYVDHKGFEKDFLARREAYFDDMSLPICKKAGINVYEIHRKAGEIKSIFEVEAGYKPHDDNPVTLESIQNADDETLMAIVQAMQDQYEGQRFAVALTQDNNGNSHALSAATHLAIDDKKYQPNHNKYKYSPVMEPANRLLMNAAQHGLKIIKFYSEQVPTSREQVNFVGAGLETMLIGDLTKARDQGGLDAMALLEARGIMRYKEASRVLSF